LAFAACGANDEPSTEPAPPTAGTATVTETVTSPEATPVPTSATPTADPPPAPEVGDTFRSDEVVVRVKKVEVVSGLADETLPDTALEALVRTCVPSGAAPFESTVFDFQAVTKTGLVITPNTLLSGVREPAYQTFGEIQPGRCVEGWVQIFMTPKQSQVVDVIEMIDYSSGSTTASWAL